MRCFLIMAVILVLVEWTGVAAAHEKPLPPAFGKELVHDENSHQQREPADAELEEQKKSTERAERTRGHGRHGARLDADGDDDNADDGADDDGL